MTQDIRPPRVDLGEVRNARGEVIGTVTISKVWFFWLRDLLKTQDDVAVSAAFDAAIGAAALGETQKQVDDLALLSQFPSATQDFGPDIEAVRLLQAPVAQVDYAADIEAVRLLSMPRAEQGTFAAKIAGRVLLRC